MNIINSNNAHIVELYGSDIQDVLEFIAEKEVHKKQTKFLDVLKIILSNMPMAK